MGPSGADMVDIVHIFVCVGGAGVFACICSPGKIMLLQSDHSCIYYDINYTQFEIPFELPGLHICACTYTNKNTPVPPHTHTHNNLSTIS